MASINFWKYRVFFEDCLLMVMCFTITLKLRFFTFQVNRKYNFNIWQPKFEVYTHVYKLKPNTCTHVRSCVFNNITSIYLIENKYLCVHHLFIYITHLLIECIFFYMWYNFRNNYFSSTRLLWKCIKYIIYSIALLCIHLCPVKVNLSGEACNVYVLYLPI